MEGTADDRRRLNDDANMAVIEHRLTSLEYKVDNGFQSLHETIIATSTTFVRLDLYLAQREGDREDIDRAIKIAMWALGLICATVIGAILVGVMGAAGLT